MSTGMLQYSAFEVSTDKFRKLDCSVCFMSGKCIDTLNFCVECKEYFCATCIKHHLNSKATDVLKRRRPGKVTAGLDLDRKLKDNHYNGRNVTNSFHQKLVQDNHADKTRPSTTDIKNTFIETRQKLTKSLKFKQDQLNSLEQEKDAVLNKIKEFGESALELLKEFQVKSEQEVEARTQAMKKEIGQDMKKIEVELNQLDTCAENIETVNIYLKSMFSKRHGEDKDDQGTFVSETISKLQLILSRTIEDFTYKINKLGNFIVEESASVFLQHEKHDIKTPDDRFTCDINDMCQLEDGTILTCDWNNAKIKRLSSSFQARDNCHMPGIPWSVCPTGPSEVAVSLFLLKKIQFVTLSPDQMTLTNTFKVGEICRGVCYANDLLIVSCGGGGLGEGEGQLKVFNKSGEFLHSITEDPAGKALFSCPFQITVSEGVIYATDRDKGLVCLDSNSNEMSTHTSFGQAKGICLGNDNNLFICDFKNGAIICMNTKTNTSKELISHNDKTRGPQSMWYDQEKKKLYIAMGNSNTIMTYQLTQADSHSNDSILY